MNSNYENSFLGSTAGSTTGSVVGSAAGSPVVSVDSIMSNAKGASTTNEVSAMNATMSSMELEDFDLSPLGEEESDDQIADRTLSDLKKEVTGLLKAYTIARSSGDEDKADQCLVNVARAKKRMTIIQECATPDIITASPVKNGIVKEAGLSLSHRDLPKFQLMSSAVREFPHDKAYESVGHFLSHFESILRGSGYRDIEAVWSQFLPLCLPHSDLGWIETHLSKCTTWAKAKQEVLRHHGCGLATRHYTDQVFTMTMKHNESISDYTNKFLQTVFNASIPANDPRVADRFLASMTIQVQTVVRMALVKTGANANESSTPWTVEFIAQTGRDILGDDYRLYGAATASIPGANRGEPSARSSDGPRHERTPFKGRIHKRGRHGNMSTAVKTFVCTHHGKNGTHDTKDCFTAKKSNATYKAKSEQKCFTCQGPWARGHKCPPEANKRVFAVAGTSDNASAKGTEALVKEAAANIDVEMNDASYDCKYKKEKLLSEKDFKTNQFNLLTPIIIENCKLVGLVDTGSETSFINKEAFSTKLKLNKINNISGSYNFLSINNNVSRIGLTDSLKIKYSNGISFDHSFEIMKFNNGFEFDVLLGTDILPKMNIGLTGVAFRIEGEHTHSDSNTSDNLLFENLNLDTASDLEPDNSPAGTAEQRRKFFEVISAILQLNLEIPVTSSCPLPESIIRLPTKEGATAFRRQYPVPHMLREVLEKQILDWLRTGTIIKSNVNTSFNSPLLLVPKRNKAGEIVSHRVCLDVRLLNNILPPTFNYPIPLVGDIFANLSGKKVFSTIDLSNAYHRFKVAPEDVHKLTFTHGNNQYAFVKGCFGVKMLTSQFQKVMAILFSGLTCVQNFVDDCIVASDSYEQHAADVKEVLERLTAANLIVNKDKCVWFQQSVRLLGFVVNTTGTKVDMNKITNVKNWPIPNQSYKQIQQFSGLINYFRSHIPLISRVAEPITRLSHAANVKELWTDEQTTSFNALKDILQSNLVLHYPDLSKPFFVATDASLYGVGAVLYQRDDKGRDKYISFISSSLSPSQRRWNTTKRELYAIVVALKKYRKYLWGKRFTIYSDHRALVYLHTQKIANSMMVGWIEVLLDFDFEVIHIPGVLNKLPDQLSRLYPPLTDEQKLVEDSGITKVNNSGSVIKKVVIKRKKYSKDKVVNVFATSLVQNKNELTNYMTPPEEERDAILQEVHTAGHYGYQAIVRDVHSRGMHWTSIYDEAKIIVMSCEQCQKHNISRKGYHPLTNIVAHRPFDHVAIDLAGPLPVSSTGHIYLLVLTDICTKYIVIRPLRNKQSDTVAKALIKIFGDYGFPFIIQSDNGTEFRNSLTKSLSENLGIDRRYTTPYHPQGNGSAEASIKIAVNALRKMIQANGRDWDHYLPIIQVCINRHIKTKTMSSPFSLMYARRVNMPDDYANKNYPLPKDMMTVKELEERIVHMENIVFPAIMDRTKKINEEYSKRYNKKNVMVDIPVGSHVMVHLRSRASKLAPIYEGPYTVTRRNKGGSYELKDEQNELLHRNYTPSELKLVNIDESAIEDEYFEVEAIRDHRGNAGHREFLVKWVGYGERADTWQKATDFTNPTIVQKYWNKQDELKRREHERAENIVADSSNGKNKIKSHTAEASNEEKNKKSRLVLSKENKNRIEKRKQSPATSREERFVKRQALKNDVLRRK